MNYSFKVTLWPVRVTLVAMETQERINKWSSTAARSSQCVAMETCQQRNR